MKRFSRLPSGRQFLLAALLLGTCLPAQGDRVPDGPRQPSAREAMWYAPTAEDWAKPVLIPWQRTWSDAVELSRATRKPILVCVNMDGEIASEHYAGVRYRDPQVAQLYEQYVCVVASVYRHTPRDYDDEGRRILCPRFGTCTCAEHMAIEPIVFEKFLDGRRIAPRHIMVELDGQKTFDVFYRNDTASVFDEIREGITQRAIQSLPNVKGDRSLLEKLQSPDAADRTEVERLFAEGDSSQRRAMLDAALSLGDAAPLEVLRLALHGLDPDQVERARAGLAATKIADACDLIVDALRAQLPPAQREALVQALERIAPESPRAQSLAVAHRGLASSSAAIDPDRWAKALGGASYAPAPERPADASAIDLAVAAAPADPLARIAQAEASLASAREVASGNKFRSLLLEDARRQATRAKDLGAPAWRVDSVLALVAREQADWPLAYAAAERAASAMPPETATADAAEVLFLFAEARQQAIVAAYRRKEPWPPQWLTDVHSTYVVLGRHPFGNDVHAGHHYDFLRFFGGLEAANQALDSSLQRFPDSPLLHERLRERVLREQGVAALEETYAGLLGKRETAVTVWFAGYAAIVAAEHHRRRGQSDPAMVAYDRAIAYFERAIGLDEAQRTSCDHHIAIALFGKSKLAFETHDLDASVAHLLAGFSRCPTATPALDGLNLSGADTARTLVGKLRESKREDLAAKLAAAMAALDPALLELPAYERETGVPRRRRG